MEQELQLKKGTNIVAHIPRVHGSQVLVLEMLHFGVPSDGIILSSFRSSSLPTITVIYEVAQYFSTNS